MSTALPGASYTIPPDGFARLDAIVGGETEPLWAFMVAMSGLGVTIEELFAMFDCTMEDGPMLGEWAVEYTGTFEPGASYDVTAEILGLEEKSGRTGHDKTSLLISVKDEVGALSRVVEIFTRSKINLSRIESRPSKRRAWEYNFYLDIEGHIKDENVAKTLHELEAMVRHLEVLGSYPMSEKVPKV